MDIRPLKPPWNAEAPMEQGRSSQCRSETTGFKEARIEGRCVGEGCHEFARFVAPLLFCPLRPLWTSP